MEMNFPKPPPDRRKKQIESIDKTETITESKLQTVLKVIDNNENRENIHINQILRKNIQDLRHTIEEYRIIKSFQPELNLKPKDFLPIANNIILFGPTGSGKSSLIKTFYQAYNNLPIIPSEINSQIIIQGLDQNEGTKKFTKITVKNGRKSLIEAGDRKLIIENSEINVFDTRGQILMDEKETQQLDLLIKGKAKNQTVVEQRTYRYAYLLWEFWKKDCELFDPKIYNNNKNEFQPHSIIFVFDGSLDEVPNGEEEISFYREIIKKARGKKFYYPQIVLTRVDKVEEKLKKMNLKQYGESEFNRESKLRELIDQKIESVVNKLGVPRSSVHFIENYHEKHNESQISIDYYALKLLLEAIKQGDNYIAAKISEKTDKCNIF